MKRLFLAVMLLIVLSGCITGPPPLTRTAEASRTLTVAPSETLEPSKTLTIEPTLTETLEPSKTPSETAYPSSTATVHVVTDTPPSSSLLNGSFEASEGVYKRVDNGSSLFPNHWLFDWRDQSDPVIDKQDNPWLPPEIIPKSWDTMGEGRELVFDGDWSLKLFKGWGPLWITFDQVVFLAPGQYQFSCAVYPDQVVDYTNGKRYPAEGDSTDWYLGSEVRLYSKPGLEPSFLDARFIPYGRWTVVIDQITVSTPEETRLVVELRGRWGYTNNGWFVDGCSLKLVAPIPTPTRIPTVVTVMPAPTVVGNFADWYAYHTVVGGDTLSAVARLYGTTVDMVVAANATRYPSLLVNRSAISIGWVLALPCNKCIAEFGCCAGTGLPFPVTPGS